MNKKKTKKNLSPSTNISRTKSLIKPPPPRTSWELLLDDYLKDPNFKSILTPKLSLKNEQSTLPTFQPISSNPFQETSIPFSYDRYPLNPSILPPRRYQMTLDELVYLISQVGRSDFYREIVQYIKTQPLSTSSHPLNKSSNINAYSTRKSTKPFVFNNQKQKKSSHSPQVQDELIEKLNRLKLNKKTRN